MKIKEKMVEIKYIQHSRGLLEEMVNLRQNCFMLFYRKTSRLYYMPSRKLDETPGPHKGRLVASKAKDGFLKLLRTPATIQWWAVVRIEDCGWKESNNKVRAAG